MDRDSGGASAASIQILASVGIRREPLSHRGLAEARSHLPESPHLAKDHIRSRTGRRRCLSRPSGYLSGRGDKHQSTSQGGWQPQPIARTRPVRTADAHTSDVCKPETTSANVPKRRVGSSRRRSHKNADARTTTSLGFRSGTRSRERSIPGRYIVTAWATKVETMRAYG